MSVYIASFNGCALGPQRDLECRVQADKEAHFSEKDSMWCPSTISFPGPVSTWPR